MNGQGFTMQSRSGRKAILLEMKNHEELKLKLAGDNIYWLGNMLNHEDWELFLHVNKTEQKKT